jgi:bifunctional oligoribonuclease and PAP phosphatase NrnA
METFREESMNTLKAHFSSKKKFTIITHFNPDGDALGSSLGLKLFLEDKGHDVTSIIPSASPPYYNWMPGFDTLKVYSDKNKAEFENYFRDIDFVFCLDFNHTSRVNSLSEILLQCSAPKILIDHHEQPSDEFQYVYSYPGKSSTAELIYDFILRMEGKESITKAIASCLYTGLITDTGGFQFSSTHASTHLMAATLIEKGIEPSVLFNNCFNNFSLNRLNLFGYCISETMKIYKEKKVAIIWIDKKTKDKFNIQEGDTEGLVNYPLKVMDIEASVLFKEDYDKIRISFRSKNDTDVNIIARKYFNGGGHKNAAGGMSKMKLVETLAFFESILEEAF